MPDTERIKSVSSALSEMALRTKSQNTTSLRFSRARSMLVIPRLTTVSVMIYFDTMEFAEAVWDA